MSDRARQFWGRWQVFLEGAGKRGLLWTLFQRLAIHDIAAAGTLLIRGYFARGRGVSAQVPAPAGALTERGVTAVVIRRIRNAWGLLSIRELGAGFSTRPACGPSLLARLARDAIAVRCVR